MNTNLRRRRRPRLYSYRMTIQPDAATGKDALSTSTAATTNIGSAATMYAGDGSSSGDQAARSYISFDVSGLAAAVGLDITSAALELYEGGAVSSGGAVAAWNVELRRLLKNWVEAQVTWSIFSTGNNWDAPGCSADTDRAADASASVARTGTAASAFVSFSGAGVVTDVRAWVAGTVPNYGWLISAPLAELQGATGQAYSEFFTSDYAVDTAKRPKLVLEFTTIVPFSA